jgi:hypothetical protein
MMGDREALSCAFEMVAEILSCGNRGSGTVDRAAGQYLNVTRMPSASQIGSL